MTLARVLASSFADAWANRRSFWVQIAVMVVNDGVWVLFWSLFFHRVGTIRGWDVNDVLVLFAILLTASGLALGLLSNSRRIGRRIADGDLDAVLTLPTSPLGYLLVRELDTALLGDLAMGPALFLVACNPTPGRAALFVVGSLAATAVLVGFLVIAGSLTFFFGGRGEQADLAFQAVLILSSYPLDIFGGATRVVLFTAIPAAFITGLPARLVRSFDPTLLAVVTGAGVLFLAAAVAVFELGLRRYRSGALWTRA